MLHPRFFAVLLLVVISISASAQEGSVTSPVLHTLIEQSRMIVVARLEEGQGVAQGGDELIDEKYTVITALKGALEPGKLLEVRRILPLGTGEKLQANVRPPRIGDIFIIFIHSFTPTGNATMTDQWLGVQPHNRALAGVIGTLVK